ncbi:anti sigma factor C-terminal domain-containing protein [Gracilibacillus sp. D59]|uniref:anti sigma factor C-terminal domain-containing protein n=1 Tax=Gracilibacillus sp. D59 TaxID=3457434 RepID=UPI003FCCE5E7
MNQAANNFLKNIKQLSMEGKYQGAAQEIADGINPKSFPKVDDLRISGVVVSGTPKELGRFQNMDFIRSSTIGATIDLY